jgi:hypothetical protein
MVRMVRLGRARRAVRVRHHPSAPRHLGHAADQHRYHAADRPSMLVSMSAHQRGPRPTVPTPRVEVHVRVSVGLLPYHRSVLISLVTCCTLMHRVVMPGRCWGLT